MPIAQAEAAVYAVLAIGAFEAGNPPSPGADTFTPIANCIGDIAPSGSTKMQDITPHGPSAWTIMFPTINTFGPVAFEIAFIPSSTGDGGHGAASGLMAVWTTNQLRPYRITWPDTTVWYFDAYISKFEVKGAVNAVVTANITLDTVGEPTLS